MMFLAMIIRVMFMGKQFSLEEERQVKHVTKQLFSPFENRKIGQDKRKMKKGVYIALQDQVEGMHIFLLVIRFYILSSKTSKLE